MQRLERQIDRLAAAEKELGELLAAHASDYTRLVELGAQLREVQAERARLEEDWLTAAEDTD
jgi:ATP-binding cassette subfamily F protein uup